MIKHRCTILNPDATNQIVADTRRFIHRVDIRDRIVFVNDEWCDFARENGADELAAPELIGRSLWSCITSAETRCLYTAMLEKVRQRGSTVHVFYRCDSPDRRRFMEMEVQRLPDGTAEFSSRIRHQELRPAVTLLQPAVQHHAGLITMCGWCKRVQLPSDEWAEVEDAVRVLRLFDVDHLPEISHGICPDCTNQVQQSLGAA